MRTKLSVIGVSVQQLSPTIVERFWRKVVKTERCWSWNGAHDTNGYGLIRAGGIIKGPIRAHQLSWLIHFGIIPEGKGVLHHCDNPGCSKPTHLFTGTQADNGRDMSNKRRDNRGNQIFHEPEARQIKRLYQTGKYSQSALGKMFNCSGGTIGCIVRDDLRYAREC